jgi:hypothetical protein
MTFSRYRIVGHAEVPPAALVPNHWNWRTHPGDQQRAVNAALAEVGWVAEVLVNQTTGHVVDGHLRLELALARREPTVPVTYVELTEDEEPLVLASLDPLAAMATAEKELASGSPAGSLETRPMPSPGDPSSGAPSASSSSSGSSRPARPSSTARSSFRRPSTARSPWR